MKFGHFVERQVAVNLLRERYKQQNRRRYAANGFAFIPLRAPDTLGCGTGWLVRSNAMGEGQTQRRSSVPRQ